MLDVDVGFCEFSHISAILTELDLLGVSPQKTESCLQAIDFGEFVAAITTFCFFEIPEILQFCFYVFDRDKNGFITQEEMVNRIFLTKFTTFLTENYKNTSKTSDNTPKIDAKYDKGEDTKSTF